MKNKKITFTTTIKIGEQYIPVCAEGSYYPGFRGTRNGFDRFAEPDEPEDFNIEKISCLETGDEIEIPDEDFDRIEQDLKDEGIERYKYDYIEEY
jgi:hypothetical protein